MFEKVFYRRVKPKLKGYALLRIVMMRLHPFIQIRISAALKKTQSSLAPGPANANWSNKKIECVYGI